jgi:hypothetical protein
VHSIRLYQILKQHLYTGTRTFEIDELKHILGVENKYKKYNDFKKYAILAAQEELQEKCDITFEFEEIKKGRKVEMLRFTIKRQEGRYNQSDGEQLDGENGELQRILMDMGLSEDQARQYVKEKRPEDIREAVMYTQERYKDGKIKSSPTAYLLKLLSSASTLVSEFEKSEKERAARQAETRRREALRRQEEARLIEQLEKDFNVRRNEMVDELVENAEEADWEAFQNWARSNMFISARLFQQGVFQRDSEESAHYFRVFLADRLPERKQAFISWAAGRGYQLHEENGRFWLAGED